MAFRDPLAVSYDGEINAFLNQLQTGAQTVSGFYHPRGFISRAGMISVPIVVLIPAGEDPGIRTRAYWQSFNYQCRLRFDPVNQRGKPARARGAEGKADEYVRGSVFWRIDNWRPATWRRAPAMAATIRIGPMGG